MGATLNALLSADESLLDVMRLPKLMPELESDCDDWVEFLNSRHFQKDSVYPNIILQCGHFKTLHDTAESFKAELSAWSKMRLPVWYDMYRTTVQRYKLTHNYDRTEEWKETRETRDSGNASNTSNDTSTGERKSAAYNSNAYHAGEKQESSGNSSGNSQYSNDAKDEFTRSVRAYGNIGVTTAQQMLEEERKLATFSIVQFIVDDFKDYFCVKVY